MPKVRRDTATSPDDAPADVEAWFALADLHVRRLMAERDPDPAQAAQTVAGLDAAIADARRRFVASLDDAGPFAIVAANAGLQPWEAEVFAVAVACEVDAGLARRLGQVQDEPAGFHSSGRMCLQTVGRVLADADVGLAAVLGLDARLRRAALVDVHEDGAWAQHVVVVHPSVLWALVGDTASDPGLPSGALTLDALPDAGERFDFVVVSGADRVRRRDEALRRVAASRLVTASVPTERAGWEALVREATLRGAGVLVELDDDVTATLSAEGRRTIERATHLAWGLSARHDLPLDSLPGRAWREFAAPAYEPDDDEWHAALGIPAHPAHRLNATQLDLVGKAYAASPGDVDRAVRRLVSGQLEQLARRVRPKRTWNDIILPPLKLAHLRDIVDRYRFAHRVYDRWGFSADPSRGIVALFSGPSGTGKTLAAEIIAGDLGLDVFKLDLSSVVSKYIGETEKNLEQVFEAASGSNVVLFFDEADSLFGKRSTVKEAKDRYANVEVSYLLQRLERYEGVVVLATNYEKNIDEAFLRRIHTRIEFVVPEPPERLLIWQHNMPPGAPVAADVDLDLIANQFDLSGGMIRNAAVHAAFLAAASDDDDEPITMEMMMKAIARELRKSGRLLKPEQFRQWFGVVTAFD